MKSNLPKLNLPNCDLKFRNSDNYYEVFDLFRKKWIKLTPEEYVRQCFLLFLVDNLNYPMGRIGVEFKVVYSGMPKRTDAVVFDDNGLTQVVVECKAPSVKIDDKAFLQAAMYNKELNAKYMFLTNGVFHYCLKIDSSLNKLILLKDIPEYKDL